VLSSVVMVSDISTSLCVISLGLSLSTAHLLLCLRAACVRACVRVCACTCVRVCVHALRKACVLAMQHASMRDGMAEVSTTKLEKRAREATSAGKDKGDGKRRAAHTESEEMGSGESSEGGGDGGEKEGRLAGGGKRRHCKAPRGFCPPTWLTAPGGQSTDGHVLPKPRALRAGSHSALDSLFKVEPRQPQCAQCGSTSASLLSCAGCSVELYCSPQCQLLKV